MKVKNVLLISLCFIVLLLIIVAFTNRISTAAKQQELVRQQTTLPSVVPQSQNVTINKQIVVKNLLASCSRLALIAEAHAKRNNSSGEIDSEAKKSINSEISRLKSIQEIFMLALMTKAIAADGEAGDASYDNVFYDTYHLCIVRLSETSGKEAALALLSLKSLTGADAGESELLEDAIEKQENKKP